MSAHATPDVVIAGAARCGTSFLAAQLSEHPAIDGGAVKEPEYFSRQFHRGPEWYESLFQPRREGLLRLDASMSYTSPRYPEALGRLADMSPDAFAVYAVRDPLHRAVSHYRLLSQYFTYERQDTFGDAIRANPVYLGASDYDRWLTDLHAAFSADRVLVAPFAVTTRGDELTTVLYGLLGLDPLPSHSREVHRHQNEVVEFRHDAVLRARRLLKRSGAYPWLRRRLGQHGMRRLRTVLTRRADPLPTDVALDSCDDQQKADIHRLVKASNRAVSTALRAQDARLGLDWARAWEGSIASDPRPGDPGGEEPRARRS
jgi:hypothetical protein